MTVEEFRGDGENFPVGMRVLAVDDDRICLKLLETLLRKCDYQVTTTSQAAVALDMLRENKDRFDLVISDVHMPDMDGFKLLELVGLEMDLPVIMLSANSDPKLVMKGVSHGACDYLVKPVRIEELKNIWQHVFRRRKLDGKNQSKSSDHANACQAVGEGHGSPLAGNTDQSGKFSRKRKDEEYESEDNENDSEDPGAQKKPRVVWSIDLHRKFVGAVNQLGIEKAFPKRILDLMNVDGLTRENVASHLQKYRLYLKRISTVATQQANMAAALGVKDSPFMHMGSLDGFGDFRSLSGARLANVALSPYTSGGMLGRLNCPANLNLRNLTPSTLVQPGQPQNMSNSLSSLGKINLLLPSSGQNSSLLQGIPSSLQLDQLQANKGPIGAANFNTVENSRMFRTAIGSSNNLLNSIRNNSMSGGGFGNQLTHEMTSFNTESFNPGVSGSANLLDPGRCNGNWQNTVESSRMDTNPLISTDAFHGQLPLNGLRNDTSSNGAYVQNNSAGLSSVAALLPFEDSREMQCESWANGIVPNLGQSLDQNNGILNQRMEMIINGRSNGSASTFMQQKENEKVATEFRQKSNEDFLLEQSKLQGGFAPPGFDSLDELVNAMIKREQDEAITNCDFGVEDYCFGAAAI